jgi:GGDEF domain-containing protein
MCSQTLDLGLERLPHPLLVVVDHAGRAPWSELRGHRNLHIVEHLADSVRASDRFEAAILPPGGRDELMRRIRLVRGQVRFALIPIVVFTGDHRESIAGVSCDLFASGPFELARLPALVASLEGLSTRVGQLPRLDSGLTRSQADDLHVLRYLVTRQVDWLEPACDATSPWGYSYLPVAAMARREAGRELAVLAKLRDAGHLAARFADRVHLCPYCDVYQLNFRQVCRSCGTAHIEPETAIHHYRCAYVGPKTQFESPRGLVCPKCQRELLHIGVEYEQITGAYECRECHSTFSDPPVECLCLQCARKFEPEQAKSMVIEAYRLTPAGREAALSSAPAHDTETVADWNMFARILRMHRGMARRYRRPFALLRIRFVGFERAAERVGPDRTRAVIQQTVQSIEEMLRDTDLLARRSDGEYFVLLPETPRAPADEVVLRVWEHAAQLRSSGLQLEIRSFSYDGTRATPQVRIVA